VRHRGRTSPHSVYAFSVDILGGTLIKKTLLFLFVLTAGLGLLQQFGVLTGIHFIDDRMARLDASLRHYAQSLESGPADDGGDGGGRLVDQASTFIDRFLEPSDSEADAQSVANAPPSDRGAVTGPAASTSIDLPSKPVEAPTPVRNEGFVVQVGVFGNPSNADRLARTLREQNSEAWTYRLDDGRHAVRIGPFRARIFAGAAAKRVEESTGLLPLVLRIN
jgi:hypothetical protein